MCIRDRHRALLEEHDDAHGTELAATAEAVARAYGDLRLAAEALHQHPNTVRYRLRKAKDLSLIHIYGDDLHHAQRERVDERERRAEHACDGAVAALHHLVHAESAQLRKLAGRCV